MANMNLVADIRRYAETAVNAQNYVTRMEGLLRAYMEAKAVEEQAQSLLSNIRSQIEAEMTIEGDDEYSSTLGEIGYRGASQYSSYDAKGIDKLLQDSPELAVVLAAYRTERSRKPSLVIKLKGKK